MYRTATGILLLLAALACIHRGLSAAVAPALSAQRDAGWGLARVSQRGAPAPHTYFYDRTGSGAQVFIVDMGIDLLQPDFEGRVDCGVDVLGNGGCLPDDAMCSHGTFLAGLVGGAGYGVAKKVQMTSVRVVPCYRRLKIQDMLDGLRWVLENREPGRPGVVLVASNFPDSGDAGVSLTRTLADVVDAGLTVVVSAGNDGMDACRSPPADITRLLPEEALVVGATQENDAVASSFTNQGPCVNLWAPGVNIYSDGPTLDGGAQEILEPGGSSVSAAFVAGAAALYLEGHPQASPAEVVRSLRDRATWLPLPDGGTLPLLYTFGTARP